MIIYILVLLLSIVLDSSYLKNIHSIKETMVYTMFCAFAFVLGILHYSGVLNQSISEYILSYIKG